MTKLQITLTEQEAMLLSSRASSFGYSLTKFVKFLLGQKAMEVSNSIPTFKMSKKAIKTAEQAMRDYKEGKTLSVNSIDELDDLLED